MLQTAKDPETATIFHNAAQVWNHNLSRPNRPAKNRPMPETAKTLRDRFALLRRLLSETDDADVSRNYLNEIVMTEAQLRELKGQKKKKPRSDG